MSEITLQNSHFKPVVLHVMHSWGGGLERWVQDYCRTDTAKTNIVLKSIGIFGTPGQRLALYQHIDDQTPTRIWELTSPIRATSITNLDYCYALEEIISDFKVSKIIISSFIGHSLNVLNTGIETIIICHDYYPFCPAINIYFGKVCNECKYSHLQHCFQENKHNSFFPSISAWEWMPIRKIFLKLILHYQITLVVPSFSIKQNLIQLEPAFKNVNFVLISHGVELKKEKDTKYFNNQKPVAKLKILVLGRLDFHKGLDLLKETYKEIVEVADIFLLGCGEAGHSFAETEGIYIVAENYALADLPEAIKNISPDLGLLLSVWPETFSYTLSELMLLGIPTVATKVGSFEERIVNGVNGFLVSASKDALIQKIKDLFKNRDLILQVAENLPKNSQRSLKEMVDDYDKMMTFTTATQEKILWGINLLQMTQVELERSQSQMQQIQFQLQLQQTQVELEQSRQRIKAMESSKFWQIRHVWFRVKQVLGLKGDE